jgi:acyl-CoA thioesterase-1
VLAAISCGCSQPTPAPAAEAVPAATTFAPPATEPGPPRLVVLGDSLTAGLGLPLNESYPALLQQRLTENGSGLEVINAGVSGDTTADGRRRVSWALEGNVRILIVALGANDGLRGLPVDQMKENLQVIIDRARQRGIRVLLAGMEAPPNYGEEYTNAFRRVYLELARANKVPLVPFLLDGVAGQPSLNQSDGMHPNRVGAARVADHLWPAVEQMVQAEATR